MATLQNPVSFQSSRIPSLKISSKSPSKIPTTKTTQHNDKHTPIKQIQKKNSSKLSKIPTAPLTTTATTGTNAADNKLKFQLTRPPLTRSHSAKESISSDDTSSSNGKTFTRTSPNVIPAATLDFSQVKSRIGSLERTNYTPKESTTRIFSEKPDFSSIASRVGSLDNINHAPKACDLRIFSEKPDFTKVHSRVGSLDNINHTPKGTGVKIFSSKPSFSHVTSRVGSLDNINHVPGGGEKYVPINPVKISKIEVKSKVGSFDNINHVPGGGDKNIPINPLKISKDEVKSKVGSFDNVKHTPRGGDVKIFNQIPNFRETAASKIKIRTRSNSPFSSESSVTNEDSVNKSLVDSPVSSFVLDEGVNSPPPEQNIPSTPSLATSLISTKGENCPIEEEADEVDEDESAHSIDDKEEQLEAQEQHEEQLEAQEEHEEQLEAQEEHEEQLEAQEEHEEQLEAQEEHEEQLEAQEEHEEQLEAQEEHEEQLEAQEEHEEYEEEYEEQLEAQEEHEEEREEYEEEEYEEAIPVVVPNDNLSFEIVETNINDNDNNATGISSQLNDVDLSFEVNVLRKSALLANHTERNTIIEHESSSLPERLSALEIPPQIDEVPQELELTFAQKQAYNESWI